MSTDTVLLEQPAPGVALVRFNRPEARNALNTEVRKRLAEIFTALVADDAIRCIVLAGSEKVFAAGADIKEQADRDVVGAMLAYTTRAIAECSKPVIAAVNGYALGGGCEFAMQCDFIIASDSAKFGQPETNLGIIPGAGGTQRLPRAVGKHNALYMLMTGVMVDAQQALRMGLVSEVVAGDAVPRAVELASMVAAKPVLATRHLKETVMAGLDMPLEAGLMLERRGYQLMFGTADRREGIAAFMEKRKPAFTGR